MSEPEPPRPWGPDLSDDLPARGRGAAARAGAAFKPWLLMAMALLVAALFVLALAVIPQVRGGRGPAPATMHVSAPLGTARAAIVDTGRRSI